MRSLGDRRRTHRPVRYRAAIARAAGVTRPDASTPADPFEGLGEDELRIFVEAAERVMAANAGKPRPGTAERWARPIRRELRRLADDVGKSIDRLERQAVSRSMSRLFRKAGPSDFDVANGVYEAFEREMADVLSQMYDEVGADAFADAGTRLGVAIDYGIRQEIFSPVDDVIGKEVKAISAASRAQLSDAVTTATNRGYSIEQLVRGVKADGFTGLRPMVDRWQAISPVQTTTDRATLIALTETANAYNYGTLDAYRASTLVEMVNVYDGSSCGWITHNDPDLAHGSRRTVVEAQAHPISHPHCQRAFGPVVAGAPPPGAPGAQSVRPPQVGPKPPSSALDLHARAIMARAFMQAKEAEPGATALMRSIERTTGGKLEGIQYRLKGDRERTVDKIVGDVLNGDPIEKARKVKDALRYTLVYEEKSYWSSVETAARALERDGNVPIKWHSNWTNPLSHDINTAWRAPNGARFELQFHTPTSWERKMAGGPGGQRASHAIYEELRALPPDAVEARARFESELTTLWKDVPSPAGSPFSPAIDPDRVP